MKKHFAQIASLTDINLCNSTFDLNITDVLEGSSLSISISIDHSFEGDSEAPIFLCQYHTEVEGLNPGNDKIFSLKVTFLAKYSLSEIQDWDEEEISTFVDKCVNFHVWPYMREHVHYISAKANIPTVILPLLPSAHERKAKNEKTSETDME